MPFQTALVLSPKFLDGHPISCSRSGSILYRSARNGSFLPFRSAFLLRLRFSDSSTAFCLNTDPFDRRELGLEQNLEPKEDAQLGL